MALQRVNGDEVVIEPAAVMAPRSTGIDIRNLQSRAHDLWAGNVVFKPLIRKLWDDVDTLLDHEVGKLLCHVFGVHGLSALALLHPRGHPVMLSG